MAAVPKAKQSKSLVSFMQQAEVKKNQNLQVQKATRYKMNLSKAANANNAKNATSNNHYMVSV